MPSMNGSSKPMAGLSKRAQTYAHPKNAHIANGWCDFERCGLKAPVIAGGQPFKTRAVGYTAEQPQAVLELLCDKVF